MGEDQPEETLFRVVVFAPFLRADLVRLHALLAAYESGVAHEDEEDHERLRRYIGQLLE